MPTIMTWNMQGGQGTYQSKWVTLSQCIGNPDSQGLQEAPEVILLQECSGVPDSDFTFQNRGAGIAGIETYSKNFGTFNRPRCYFIAHYLGGAQNNRVSFAILIRTNDNNNQNIRISDNLTGNVVLHAPPLNMQNMRPIIGIDDPQTLYTFYSMHAPSGVQQATSRAYIGHMMNQVDPNRDNIIGGDFNCQPVDLNPIPQGWNTLFTNDSTYTPINGNPNNYRVYDYFAFRPRNNPNNNQPNNQLHNEQLANPLSDHRAVSANY